MIAPRRGARRAAQVIGRYTTGKRRATPMGYLRENHNLLLVVAEHGRHADWVKNSLAAGEVSVAIGRRRHRARVRVRDDLVPDSVLRRMKPLQAFGVRRLAFEPKVIEVQIL